MIHVAVHADPLSEGAIRRMQHWITRCNEKHANCKVQDPALPTRLLDVDNPQLIKLCNADSLTDAQRSPYIALSHCWGLPNKTFLTTRDTIAEMKAGFPIGDAPATFRDAIRVTRCLGIRYLWIDSLCIIQRDDDWKLEASRMGSVYANSFLTIAAANAKDDNDGFLCTRTDVLTSLKIMSSTGRSAQVYLQTQDDGINVHAYNTKQPLDTRGWTLQERYLPQRTLQFGSTEISWECQCTKSHESQTDHYSGISHSTLLLKPYPTDSGGFSYSSWYTMVFMFTGRALRYDTDKLPALSGLATEVAKFNQGTYYAGLWWEDMASGLLWYRGCASELDKPSAFLAPSWSWASLNGHLIYDDQPAKVKLADVAFHDCELERELGKPYGAVKSGWLHLSAPIVKLHQCDAPDSWRSYDDGLETAFKFAHLDGPLMVATDNSDEDEERDPYDTTGNFETRGILDLIHEDHTDFLGLLLMFSSDKNDFGSKNRISSQEALDDPLHWSTLYGILIEKFSMDPPAYKRVGYFSAMRLEAGEAAQIRNGAEVQRVRLY